MKKLIVLLAIIAVSFSANSQANKTMNAWAELNSFHKVMSETFHPSEDGNLKPIKMRSKELLDLAVALHQSKVPAGIDAAKMSENTMRLAVACKELYGLTELNESDEAITKKLAEAHNIFHDIAGMCESLDKVHDHSDPNHKH